ncbi:hypothetical protein [Jannaschia formosa]|uniref:hypothetical protein n=1 Tax=Jannaschia formosa TaxID=2259592 RepID=UPI001074D046|nr:hypothetical protein [Jannaschia formosa]TFL18305.1 hypothetical protein DR046_09410 [Jannaschia formosa]
MPRMIFTVTAGRTGTTLLARLLDLLPKVRATHEPEPKFAPHMRSALIDRDAARQFLIHEKLPVIEAVAEPVYVETANLFCKGFFEPMAELRPGFGVIFLRRDPGEIAHSYLSRDTVPGRNRLGIKFLLQPDDPGVLPIDGWQDLTDYQLCFWYALEIERRQLHYRAVCDRTGQSLFSISTEELCVPDRFRALCAAFGLSVPEGAAFEAAFAAIAGKKHNRNRAYVERPPDAAAQEAEVRARIRRAAPHLLSALEAAPAAE